MNTETKAALKAKIAALETQLAEKEEWTARFIAAMDPVCGAYFRCTAREVFDQSKLETPPPVNEEAFAPLSVVLP